MRIQRRESPFKKPTPAAAPISEVIERPKPTAPRPEPRPPVSDVLKTKKGQDIVRRISATANQLKEFGKELLLTMPTREAYRTEQELFQAIERAEQTPTIFPEPYFSSFIATHTVSNRPNTNWTGADVPLFYVSAFHNGEYKNGATANEYQTLILQSVWKMQDSELNFKTVRL